VRRLPVALTALVAALGAAAMAAVAAPEPTRECNGIRECLRAEGTWVVLPARASAVYLLDCPRRQGVVGGVDARASSGDVHITFDGQLGAPVAPGTTTTRYAFFHALSAAHRRGSFQPLVGCIPVSSNQRSKTSAYAAPGAPLILAAATVRLRPGVVRRATLGCVPGQRLVETWHAVAFRTRRQPEVSLADAIRVQRTQRGRQVAISIATSEALPAAARAEVQLGVMCSAP